MVKKRREWYKRWCKKCGALYWTIFPGSRICGECDHSPMFKNLMSHYRMAHMLPPKVKLDER